MKGIKVLNIGDTARIELPFSEVCTHLGIAGKTLDVVVKPDGAQIMRDGKPYSFPILHSEAGIYRNADGAFYNYVELIPSSTCWACQCCTLVMASGECCDRDTHGGDGMEPLADIPEGAHVTAGGAEHGSHCDRYQGEHDCRESWFEPDDTCEQCQRESRLKSAPDYQCDCDRIDFTNSRCDGCGSYLAGERRAFIIWSPAEELTGN